MSKSVEKPAGPPRVLVAAPSRLAANFVPYISALELAGAAPEIAWPAPTDITNNDSIDRFLVSFAGLLLPGGGDVDPARYQESANPLTTGVQADLDASQLALAKRAIETGYPTLAICRGIQVLTVAAGGALYQDLPTEYPARQSAGIRHRTDSQAPKATIAHDAELDPASRLAQVSGTARFPVNSRHHQAARERPSDRSGWIGPLKIVARADDGVVEGVEAPDQPFCIGVQWHPENLTPAYEPARRLFAAFVASCQQD